MITTPKQIEAPTQEGCALVSHKHSVNNPCSLLLANFRPVSYSRGLSILHATCALAVLLASPLRVAADSSQLEEVLVSGTADPRLGSLLTSTEIRSLSEEEQISLALSPASLASAIPGVALNGQGGLFQSYSLRGFSRGRIRTEISGVPILTDRRAGNSLSFLPPGLIDTVRVNMGPASSLYGSGAMGGVMNVSLNKPTETSVSIGASSMGRARNILVSAPISARTSLVGNIRRASTSKSAEDTRLNTGYEQSALYVSDKTYFGDNTLATEVLVSNGSDIGKSSALFPINRVTDYPYDNHRLINLRLTTSDQWFVQAYTHKQNWASLTQRSSNLNNKSVYSSTTIGGLLSRSIQEELSSQRYGLDMTRRHNVNIRERTEAPNAVSVTSNVVDDGSEWTAGLFWERTWFHDGFSLQGGIRADTSEANAASSSTTHSDINLQLKADWQLGSSLGLTAEMGSAYRLPTLSELYFEGETPRGRLVGNQDLQSEEAVGAQFTLVYDGENTIFEITASANRVDQYIERIRLLSGIESYRNLASGDLWGIDGQLRRRNNDVEHTFSWQWQQGESADGDVIADLPPPSIRYAVMWQRSGYSLGTDLRYRFSRDKSGPGELSIGSAVILGVAAKWMINPQWTMKASITNALGRNYRTSATENAPFDIGRSINLKIEWRP